VSTAYPLYLFDLDGTLIDSIALILASHHHTRLIHFGDRLPDDHYLETLGMTLRETFRRTASSSREVEAMVRTYVEHNAANHDSMVVAYPGVVETIRQLSHRGVRLGIVTSKLKATAERGLRVAGLEGAFEIIVSAEEVTRGKPDPEPVLLALQRFGHSADEAVFVGDSPHDIHAGNRANVSTAAVTWGPFPRASLEKAGPVHWAERPEDLLSLTRRARSISRP
jgi:pyrophosphatase PpaX